MYAAHAEQKKKETSLVHLQSCLNEIHSAGTDNELFAALLEVTQHVRDSAFTDDNRQTVLKAAELEFLIKLLNSDVPEDCPPSLYKVITLSFLSAWTTEPYVVNQPEMKKFLSLVNDVLALESPYNTSENPNAKILYEQMCRECEDIVSNLARQAAGISHLIDCGTVDVFVDYVLSPKCQNIVQGCESLSHVVKSKGDLILQGDTNKFNSLMELIIERLGQGSDLREKTECAKILTSFLNGICVVEISVQCEWVGKLVRLIQKLIQYKMAPDENEVILNLVCALVSAVGAEALSPDVAGDTTLLKAVVARASVDVYMFLDCITLDNARERYHKLDRVYKLLSSMVKYLAEFGEVLDSESVVVIYKKLVDVSDLLMEFLVSVANQQVELPRNHSVVLVTVRTLAAMLSEITEDPTPKLLELVPFFNLLCQNVEYSDDVILEVKNATQAALENIKLMGMGSIPEDDEPRTDGHAASSPSRAPPASSALATANAETTTSSGISEQLSTERASICSETENALAELNISSNASDRTSGVGEAISDSVDADPDTVEHSVVDKDKRGIDPISASTLSLSSISTTDFYIDLSDGTAPDNQNDSCQNTESSPTHTQTNILLSEDNINDFKAFQVSVSAARSRPRPLSARRVSFSSKHKKKNASSCDSPETDQSQQWKPTPDDVLGFLLPTYAFLLDNEEALEVMVRSDTFQTIVSFLESSLSQFLESKSSVRPESMTINALSVIEQVYTNSPTTAARLKCFQQLFEISVLSVPNLLSLLHPPHLVCLKFLEVSLAAYRLQMMGNKRNSSLPRMKHSQTRFFKAAVEYLTSVYEIRQRPGRSSSLRLTKEIQALWSLAEVSWCGCVAGLCTLVRSADDLQEVLVKSPVIPHFLTFLRDADPELSGCKEESKTVIESMFSLIESAAENSDVICEMILHSDGKRIASKFKLQKLARSLKNLARSS